MQAPRRAALLFIILSALVVPRAWAQVPPASTPEPKFDVASIKPNRMESTAMNGSNRVGNGRLNMINYGLRVLIANAYDVNSSDQVREIQTYEMVLARPDGRLGPGLRQHTVDCRALALEGKERCGWSAGGSLHTATAQPLVFLIDQITNSVERRIVDKTGLTGQFAHS